MELRDRLDAERLLAELLVQVERAAADGGEALAKLVQRAVGAERLVAGAAADVAAEQAARVQHGLERLQVPLEPGAQQCGNGFRLLPDRRDLFDRNCSFGPRRLGGHSSSITP